MIDLDKPWNELFPAENFTGAMLTQPLTLTIRGVEEFATKTGPVPRLRFVETPTGLLLNKNKQKALLVAFGDVPRNWVGGVVVLEKGHDVMYDGQMTASTKMTVRKEQRG